MEASRQAAAPARCSHRILSENRQIRCRRIFLRRFFATFRSNLCRNQTFSGRFSALAADGEPLAFVAHMDRTDVERLADSVLRQYGVPLKVAGIASTGAEWT